MAANALLADAAQLNQRVQLILSSHATIDAQVVELLASLITNDSSVPGATVKDALNNLLVSGASAYDHVVRTIADLPAAVAGIRDLTTGSWAFTEPIDLGSDILRAPSGTEVLLAGLGPSKTLTGDGAAVLRIEGTATLQTMSVGANAGGGIGLHINSGALDRVTSFGGQYSNAAGASSESVRQDAGFWYDIGSTYGKFNGGTDAYAIYTTSSEAHFTNCSFVGSNNGGNHRAIYAENVYQVTATDCICSAPGNTVELAGGSLKLTDCVLYCSNGASNVIRSSKGDDITIVGGQWFGSGGPDGFLVDGNITSIQLSDIYCFSLGADLAFVDYNAGTVGGLQINNCRVESTVSHAVNWPAASLPTLGTLIVGNIFDTSGAAFVGFTHASALVNSKANADSGGLMSETPIVP